MLSVKPIPTYAPTAQHKPVWAMHMFKWPMYVRLTNFEFNTIFELSNQKCEKFLETYKYSLNLSSKYMVLKSIKTLKKKNYTIHIYDMHIAMANLSIHYDIWQQKLQSKRKREKYATLPCTAVPTTKYHA